LDPSQYLKTIELDLVQYLMDCLDLQCLACQLVHPVVATRDLPLMHPLVVERALAIEPVSNM
jgi:hypothetical protein